MKIHNTLTNSFEEFKAIGNEVKIYVCGPTVYNLIHIGNARPLVFFDVVRRYLERTYKVTFIQNFTDIDDKIITIARSLKVPFSEIGEKYINEFYTDSDYLNVKRATHYPKVTEYIKEMIQFIESLIEQGYAYTGSDGIYFQVSKLPSYGCLSNRHKHDESEEGVNKFSNEDFALWKFEKDENISWNASFGQGRPGWHIECSAMINALENSNSFGNVDIHAGGQDLIFPHHENEIAQTKAVFNHDISRYWMHNALVKMDSNKMSKSSGNFYTVRELSEKYSGNVIRLFILSTHYMKPISFSLAALDAAKEAYSKIEDFLSNEPSFSDDFGGNILETKELDEFYTFMEELNTQGALSSIFSFIKSFNKTLEKGSIEKKSFFKAKALVKELLDILGFKTEEEKVEDIKSDLLLKAILKLRDDFRSNKNWQAADMVRDEMLKIGLEFRDGKDGTTIKRKSKS